MPEGGAEAKMGMGAVGRWMTPARWQMVPLWGCVALLCAVVLGVHAHKYPDFSGFFAGVDQRWYLESARAYYANDFAPAHHHYLPLYALIASPFVFWTPWQPFMWPDLLFLVLSLWFFVKIGKRLAPGWPPGVVAACFVIAVMSGRTALAVWVVPWSTTGSAMFAFAAVLATLKFAERPSGNLAWWAATTAVFMAGFRPSDAAVMIACCAPYAVWGLCRSGAGWRVWGRSAAGALTGALFSGWLVFSAYSRVHGHSASEYVTAAASIGFEWRLLAMRWVMIVLGARPLLPEGVGMAVAWPWIAPGCAGLVLAVMMARRRGGAGVLVATVVVVHWCLYLCYRDLQPYGLWRFYNVHYFKWTFPFLVLWAAQVAAALYRRETRVPAMVACGLAAMLFVWRPVLRDPVRSAVVMRDSGLVLPPGALRLDRAVALPVQGSWAHLYFDPSTVDADGRAFVNTADFKVLPVGADSLLTPLRELPRGESVFHPLPGARVDLTQPLVVWRQGLEFGLPVVGR